MKRNELRIGSIININGEDITPGIGYGVIQDFAQKSKGLSNSYLDTLKFTPILITNDWLLNLGFYKVSNGFEIDCNNGIKINSLFTGKPLTLEVHGLRSPLYELKYVHQLQNLYFSLTGVELEIKH